jgi:cytochrome c556
MTDDKEEGFSIRGLFIKEGDHPDQKQPTKTTSTPTQSSGAAPSLLSISSGATVPTSSGPSARTLEMVAAAQKQIPADNAQLKLDAAMESIKAIEPDAIKRRAMALAMLGSQGISADTIEGDAVEARKLMSDFIATLSSQLKTKRENGVDSVRTQATTLREQATGLESEITKIREKQTKLNGDAEELEAKATTEENSLNAAVTDVEAALTIINSGAK